MEGTIVKELVVKGDIKDSTTTTQQTTPKACILAGSGKEQLIEECLERLKNYLKYEADR